MAYSGGNNIVDEIKSRCDIVDVIGRAVPLKRAGSNYKGLCPFHNEKTPSFIVSGQKQHFTCFGCGKSGDVIKFVELYNNLDFRGACEKLAAEYGISTEGRFGNTQRSNELYEINREAAKFFFMACRSKRNPGYDYMAKRGITPETMTAFGIGYADGEWTTMCDHFKESGTDAKKLVSLGLASSKQGTDRIYDKFRSRVMFPIINTNGKVIGFGGREIDGSSPKYLNSPESSIFQKKNNLYGLGLKEVRTEIGKQDTVVLVEGYMDVISLFQAGIKNVAATLGTALTENQATLLKRYSKNVILCYDSDNAGINATVRGLEILYNAGINARAMHVTDGKDPDEFIKKNGRKEFLKLMDKALPYGDYMINRAYEKHKDRIDSIQGRRALAKEVAQVLRSMSPVDAELYLKKAAATAGVSEGALRAEVFGNGGSGGGSPAAAAKQSPANQQTGGRSAEAESEAGAGSSEITPEERHLIKLILEDPSLYGRQSEFVDYFRSDTGSEILSAIGGVYREDEPIDMRLLADQLSDKANAQLDYINDNIKFAGNNELVFAEVMNKLEIKRLEERAAELRELIPIAEAETDGAEDAETGEQRKNALNAMMSELRDIKIKTDKLRADARGERIAGGKRNGQ